MTELKKGAFLGSLERSNKDIKLDRARAIGGSAEMAYRRSIEDMEQEISMLRLKREGMLDLSPSNAMNLMVVDKFDADRFHKEDERITIEIALLTKKKRIKQARYNYLFLGQEDVSDSIDMDIPEATRDFIETKEEGE